MKKALITGINGQDGSFLAELLLSKGYKVYGFAKHRNCTQPGLADNIEFIKNHWEHVPFFVSLSHHFFNGISGHARSIYIAEPKNLNIFSQNC